MEHELFTEIESALWVSLMKLSENMDKNCEYLKGYFCACEDISFIFSILEKTATERMVPELRKRRRRSP